MKDYTCVATPELARAFGRVRDVSVPLARIAERAAIDERDLKRIVGEKKYRTTSLGVADRILTAVGANITALDMAGELTVIPGPGKDDAARMALDEWWAERDEGRPDPGPQERRSRDARVRSRAAELVALRKAVLDRQ
jgi:hypothetical protein